MNEFIKPFKKLPEGVYRIIIVSSFLTPLLVGIILSSTSRTDQRELFIGSLIGGFFIFWILARIGLWVYEGFSKEENK